MSEAQKIKTPLSVAEYLEGEKSADVRHEFIGGQVYAMAGGSQNHCRIILNIGAALDDLLHSGPCRTFTNDMKVKVSSVDDDSFYYPDVMVGCDPEDQHDFYIEKPSVILEVLSDSTERIDRNEKFHAYRSIPSLMEYVLVSQKKKEVTLVRRKNGWKAEVLSSDIDALVLPSIGQSLSLSRIYRNIDFN